MSIQGKLSDIGAIVHQLIQAAEGLRKELGELESEGVKQDEKLSELRGLTEAIDKARQNHEELTASVAALRAQKTDLVKQLGDLFAKLKSA